MDLVLSFAWCSSIRYVVINILCTCPANAIRVWEPESEHVSHRHHSNKLGCYIYMPSLSYNSVAITSTMIIIHHKGPAGYTAASSHPSYIVNTRTRTRSLALSYHTRTRSLALSYRTPRSPFSHPTPKHTKTHDRPFLSIPSIPSIHQVLSTSIPSAPQETNPR